MKTWVLPPGHTWRKDPQVLALKTKQERGGKVKRVVLVSMALVFAISLFSLSTAFADTVTLRWAHPSPARGAEKVWLDYFSSQVAKRTQGRVKVQVFWGGSLVKLKEMAAAVKNGLADVGWVASSYHPAYTKLGGLYRAASLFALLDDPIQATSRVLRVWETTPVLYEEYLGNNMVPIVQRYYDLFWIFSSKPINALVDLKGKRIRTVGDAQQVAFLAVGASPTFLPAGEIYSAMQKGIIDAVVLSPDTANRYKVHEVAKYASRWNLAFNFAQWCMNLDTWKKLSWLDQMTVIQVGKETSMLIAELMDSERKTVIDVFKKEGISISDPSKQDIQKWESLPQVQEFRAKWIKEVEGMNMPGRQVMDIYLKTMTAK